MPKVKVWLLWRIQEALEGLSVAQLKEVLVLVRKMGEMGGD